jgi:hypothetical protein
VGDSRLRSSRVALLIALAMMHAFAVRELFWRPFLAHLTEKPASGSISWISLPPPIMEQPKAADDVSVAPLPLLAPNSGFELILPPPAPALPSVSPPSSAPVIAVPSQPADSAILGGLGQSLSCNLANYDKLPLQEKERCLKRLAELRNAPASSYVAADEEKRLTQQFAHELAVKQAPPLLPCFNSIGMGVSDLCLMRGALNGFDFSDAPTYADAQRKDE